MIDPTARGHAQPELEAAVNVGPQTNSLDSVKVRKAALLCRNAAVGTGAFDRLAANPIDHRSSSRTGVPA